MTPATAHRDADGAPRADVVPKPAAVVAVTEAGSDEARERKARAGLGAQWRAVDSATSMPWRCIRIATMERSSAISCRACISSALASR